MIIHTVAFKMKHETGSAEEQSFLKAGIEILGSLPTVKNFQCFRQVGKKSDLDFGLSMEFESEEDYEAYNNHPNHMDFVSNRWIPEVESFQETDYVKYEFS